MVFKRSTNIQSHTVPGKLLKSPGLSSSPTQVTQTRATKKVLIVLEVGENPDAVDEGAIEVGLTPCLPHVQAVDVLLKQKNGIIASQLDVALGQ